MSKTTLLFLLLGCLLATTIVSASSAVSLTRTTPRGIEDTSRPLMVFLGEMAPLTSQVTVTQPLSCTAGAEVEVSVSGGTAPYAYSFDGSSYNSMVGSTATIGGLQPGVYDVFVRDTNQEVVSTSLVIQSIPPITLNATVTDPSCFGATDASISAVAQGGTGIYFFQLLDMQGNTLAGPQSSAVFTNLSPGLFVLEVVDDGGCTVQDTVVLAEPAPLTADLTSENVTSAGGSDGRITIGVQGGIAPYELAVNDTFQYGPLGSGIVSNLVAGTYSLHIRDTNGCELQMEATITEPPVLVATALIQSQMACGTFASVMLSATGGVPPYEYSNDGISFSTENVYSIGSPGTTSFTVRDAMGVTASSNSVTITEGPTQVSANLRTSYDCNGVELPRVTFELTEGTGTIEYSLYPDIWQNDPEFLNVPDGVYSAKVRNEGCHFETTITVANVIPVQVRVVEQNQGWARFEIVNGEAPFNYRIDDYGAPRVSVGNERFFEIDGFTPGPHWLVVEGAHCSDHVTFDVEGFIPELEIVVEAADITCHGAENGTIQVSGLGGLGTYNYGLVDGNNTIVYPVRPETTIFENLSPGTYQALLRDITLGQLVRSEMITIAEPEMLSIGIRSTTPAATGESNGSVTLDLTGGTPPYSYALDAATAYQLLTGTSIEALPSGTHLVKIQDSNGCQAEVMFSIGEEIFAPLTADLEIEHPNCATTEDGRIRIVNVQGGSGNYVYALDSPDIAQAQNSNLFSAIAPGVHFISVFDSDGNRIEVPFELVAPEPLEATAEVVYGEETAMVSLSASGGTSPYRYAIDGLDFQTSNVFENLSPGEYSMSVQDFGGCVVTLSMMVEEPQNDSDKSNNGVDIKVFQNPGHTETLDLEWEPTEEAVTRIVIYNGKGTLVHMEEWEGEKNQTQINVSGLSRGIYFVHITTGGLEEVKKVLIL